MMNTRYTGPTLLTYEEWWAWDRARRQAGKWPSQRRVVRWCTTCAVGIEERYCPHTFEHVCERVIITYDKKEPYEDGEGPVY